MSDTVMHIPIDDDTSSEMMYWMRKGNFTSKKEFVATSIKFYTAFLNGDAELSDKNSVRLNQLTSQVEALSNEVNTLSRIVDNGFKTLLNLTEE